MKRASCFCIAILLLLNCLGLAGCNIRDAASSGTTGAPQTSTPPPTDTQVTPVGTEEDLQALIDAWNAVIVQRTFQTHHIEWHRSAVDYPILPTRIPISDDHASNIDSIIAFIANLPIDPEGFELYTPIPDKLPANMGMKLTFWGDLLQTYDEEGYENGELVLPLTIRVSLDNAIYIELKSNPTVMACYRFSPVDHPKWYNGLYVDLYEFIDPMTRT